MLRLTLKKSHGDMPDFFRSWAIIVMNKLKSTAQLLELLAESSVRR